MTQNTIDDLIQWLTQMVRNKDWAPVLEEMRRNIERNGALTSALEVAYTYFKIAANSEKETAFLQLFTMFECAFRLIEEYQRGERAHETSKQGTNHGHKPRPTTRSNADRH